MMAGGAGLGIIPREASIEEQFAAERYAFDSQRIVTRKVRLREKF